MIIITHIVYCDSLSRIFQMKIMGHSPQFQHMAPTLCVKGSSLLLGWCLGSEGLESARSLWKIHQLVQCCSHLETTNVVMCPIKTNGTYLIYPNV